MMKAPYFIWKTHQANKNNNRVECPTCRFASPLKKYKVSTTPLATLRTHPSQRLPPSKLCVSRWLGGLQQTAASTCSGLTNPGTGGTGIAATILRSVCTALGWLLSRRRPASDQLDRWWAEVRSSRNGTLSWRLFPDCHSPRREDSHFFDRWYYSCHQSNCPFVKCASKL